MGVDIPAAAQVHCHQLLCVNRNLLLVEIILVSCRQQFWSADSWAQELTKHTIAAAALISRIHHQVITF